MAGSKVSIDGMADAIMKEYDVEKYRNAIGVVFQDFHIFFYE